MNGPMVSLENVSKSFRPSEGREIRALRDVSVTAESGKMTAIAGRSGSGKSTLLHVMGTLLTPDSGTVRVGGVDVSSLSARELARFRNSKMGFVFQSFFLENALSAWENAALPLLAQKRTRQERKKLAERALDRVGLKNRMSHRPGELSGGEMQRVCLARAIITDPAIVFADEPTGNLDTASSRMVMDLLRGFVTPSTGVILVTHSGDDAKKCDRIVLMSDGAVAAAR